MKVYVKEYPDQSLFVSLVFGSFTIPDSIEYQNHLLRLPKSLKNCNKGIVDIRGVHLHELSRPEELLRTINTLIKGRIVWIVDPTDAVTMQLHDLKTNTDNKYCSTLDAAINIQSITKYSDQIVEDFLYYEDRMSLIT